MHARAVPTEVDAPALDQMRRVAIALHDGRVVEPHPVDAMVVPTSGLAGVGATPHRLRPRIRRCRHVRRTEPRAVQVHRRRTDVLEHSTRPDAQVRLAVVAHDDDIMAVVVRQLDPIAEIDHTHRETRDARRDVQEPSFVVACRHATTVRRSRLGRGEHDGDREDHDEDRCSRHAWHDRMWPACRHPPRATILFTSSIFGIVAPDGLSCPHTSRAVR